MELRSLWKIARRRWWIILLPSVTAFAYAAYLYAKSPHNGGFSTAIRFTAAQPPADESKGYEDGSYYPWLASEYVVNALTDWVQTSTFRDEVSAALKIKGVDISSAALQGAGLRADNQRSVMVLYANWPDPNQLQAIADAATDVLKNRSGAYFPQLGQQGLSVVPLDDPAIAPVPAPLSQKLNPLLRFAVGMAAGIALAFLIDYLDPTLHDRGEVEAIGLPVIAEIPG